jgi:hypothetical protein
MEFSETFRCYGHQALYVGCLGHVANVRDDSTMLAGRLGEVVSVPCSRDDVRALAGKRHGDGSSDSLGRASHDGDSPLK